MTQPNDRSGKSPSYASPGNQLEQIIIMPDDVPQGFTLTEGRVKNSTEMSSLALGLGWKRGYSIRYDKGSGTTGDPVVLTQNIAVYPSEKMPTIVNLVQTAARSAQEYSITDLPDPEIGDLSRASVAFIAANQTSSEMSESDDLFVRSRDSLGHTTAASGQEPAYYEIVFTKDEVFEVLRLSGPAADYETLLDLARVASEKI